MNTVESYPVCVVGRNKLFRAAFKVLLQDLQFNVVREYDTVDEVSIGMTSDSVLSRIKLVVFDLASDAASASDALSQFHERLPNVPVIVLTESFKPQLLEACITAGAAGYLTKDISLDALKHSLLLVAHGEKVYPSQLAEMMMSGVAFSPMEGGEQRDFVQGKLSARERAILACLVRGDPNKVIALHLRITEATVKVHMKNLLRKIAATNRTQAAIWAVKNHLGTDPAELSSSNLR
jgi:two-component system nitrate/nitrite response regulator NarL